MTHPRQTILDTILWRLKTPRVPAVPANGATPAVPAVYWTACGTKVFTNRQMPVQAKSCPLIIIHQGDEKAEDDQDGAGTIKRHCVLNIDVMVAVDDAQDAIANLVAWQAEQAIWTLPRDIRAHWTPALTRTESFLTRERQDADGLFGIVRLVYTVTYHTAPALADDGQYAFPPLTWPGAGDTQPPYEPEPGDLVSLDPAERAPVAGPLPGLEVVPDPTAVTAYGSTVPYIGPDYIDRYEPMELPDDAAT